MRKLFNFDNFIIFIAYSLNLMGCLFLYAYFSISAQFLAKGALPNDDFLYLPLDKIYIAILLISFFYYTFCTAYLTKTPLYEQKSSNFFSIGWLIDSILIFSFLAYCVAVNYIAYYNSISWKTFSIFKSFLTTNSTFYISLIVYLLINCTIHNISINKETLCQK